MAEIIEAIVFGIAALIELLIRLVLHSVSLIAYAVSPGYRRKRQAVWSGQRRRKYAELGFSGACMASLAALAIYASLPAKRNPGAEKAAGELVNSIHLEPRAPNEDLRIRIKGVQSNAIISVQTNGLSNILATKTIRDLTNAIRRNVAVEFQKQTN